MTKRTLAVLIALNLVGATYAIVTRADQPAEATGALTVASTTIAPPPAMASTSTSTSTSTTTTEPPTTTTAAPPVTAPAASSRVEPFRGLGVWIDVFDYSPAYTEGSDPATIVTPAHVEGMAARGVKTIYIQAARDDERTPGDVESPELLGQFLTQAHAHSVKVVGWYLPKLYDDADLRRFRAIRDFRAGGQGFDAIGNDIEFRAGVPDVAERNRRLVELSQRLRAESGELPVAAIVLPPVVTDIVNPSFWPGFPWTEIAPHYDVWMPMAYWTNRKAGSEWRGAHRYVTANVEMVRSHLGLPDAPVHPIGGIGDAATLADYQGFIQAAHEQGSIGASMYDFRTTAADAWPVLAGSPS